jgi:hypothetical protein
MPSATMVTEGLDSRFVYAGGPSRTFRNTTEGLIVLQECITAGVIPEEDREFLVEKLRDRYGE